MARFITPPLISASLYSYLLQVEAPKNSSSDKPRLCVYAGRTQSAVEDLLTTMAADHSEDMQVQALLEATVPGAGTAHRFRGYTVLNSEPNVMEVKVFTLSFFLY